MDTAKMTVNQITSLLSQQDISLHIIDKLKNDARISVRKLVDKWDNHRQAMIRERQRLADLYLYEQKYADQGFQLVAGTDEAGRGPLAGPVVVGAVILPLGYCLPGLNDSKKLSALQRERLYTEIKKTAVAAVSVVIDVETIDEINIYQATVKGMYTAIAGLNPSPNAVLSDAVPLDQLQIPYTAIIGGDQVSASIAAASIVAKVERDRIMNEIDSVYPMYGFARHKGYGTKEHLDALAKFGPCQYHRQSFAPVKGCPSIGSIS